MSNENHNLQSISALVAKGRWQDAYTLVTTYENDNPVSAPYYLLKGRIVQHVESPDSYLSHVLQAINAFPDNMDLHKQYVQHCDRHHLFHLHVDALETGKAKFPDQPFFYQRELELYRKLTAFDTLLSRCNAYIARFPNDPFGIYQTLEALLLLKRKGEAAEFYNAHKHQLPSKLLIRYHYHFHQYKQIDNLCDTELSKGTEYLYWLSEKIRVNILMGTDDSQVQAYYTTLINHPDFTKNHLGYLLHSSFIDKKIEDHLITEVENLNLPQTNGLQKYIDACKNIRSFRSPEKTTSHHKKIDLVYTWVDMSDPKFRERFVEANGFDPYQSTNLQHNHTRYTHNGEIRFALLTAEKYFEDVNHVYIVTHDQYFDLDFLSASFRSKVSFVNQEDILPTEYITQAVFDSNLIETFIWNIPNIANHIMYCCDDYFFGNYVREEYLFDKDGNLYATVMPQSPPNLDFEKALIDYFGQQTKYQAYNYNAYTQYSSLIGEVPQINDLHLPMILSRDACKRAFDLCKDLWSQRFFKNSRRSNDSVFSLLTYTWYAIQHQYQVPGPYHHYKKNAMIFNSGLTQEGVDMLLAKRPLFFCINFLPDEMSLDLFHTLSTFYLSPS